MTLRSTSPHLALTCFLLCTSGGVVAQENQEKTEPSIEEQMLDDFGSGLKVVGWTLQNDDIDLREIWGAAADALFPDKSDEGMAIYLEDYEANQQREELESFGADLKTAVQEGLMSREEAYSTWLVVMDDDRKGGDEAGGKEEDWSLRMENSARNGRLSAIHLRIPDGGDVRILTRPEFHRRDLQYFARELELDDSARAVIEVLLEDYVSAYERRTEELISAIRDSRARAGRQWRIEEVDRARTMIGELAGSIDWDQARAMVEERVADGKRMAGMLASIDRFANALPEVSRAIDRRHASLDRAVEIETGGADVLMLAADLQSDRLRMRSELIESMRLVLDDRQQRMIEGIFDQFILEQGRIDSKLGGSRIDLEAAVEATIPAGSARDDMQGRLDAAQEELLQLVDEWTEARIDRERSGLELFVAYAGNGERAAERMTGTHAQRATRELNAAVAIRDRLLAASAEIEDAIAESDQEAARRFADITRRQGFAPQMRPRWSERAMESALACNELTEADRDSLADYQQGVMEQLEPIRLEAIRERMEIEPRIARQMIRRITGDAGDPIGLSAWREPGADRFVAVDDLVDAQLRSVLQSLGCVDALPRRPGRIEQGKGTKPGDKDPGKGAPGKGEGSKGGGSKGGTGKGLGRGSSGGKS